MNQPRSFLGPVLLAAGVLAASGSGACAELAVDLSLVLAVDVSASMEPVEQELQRAGFIEAFRSPALYDAVRRGVLGRIAVTYIEWAGETEQSVVIPWTVIKQPTDAIIFADLLSQAPLHSGGFTSLSGVIEFGMRLLEDSHMEATRQAIDISGDGPNNKGRPVTWARDDALARGIVINGLPIMIHRPSVFPEMENLDGYFRECVIGGPGSFMIPVQDPAQFMEAIRAKLIREIAGRPELQSLTIPAQARDETLCLAGEIRLKQQLRH
ncbi:DUF1194 domain-containing protein [Microvirga yunnanensis]|nr:MULTISPECIES: DUF1194 domain-containing protein [unclassified Microvirga]